MNGYTHKRAHMNKHTARTNTEMWLHAKLPLILETRPRTSHCILYASQLSYMGDPERNGINDNATFSWVTYIAQM